MSNWGADFLQALGWSTLNSIWQMAILWALFHFIQYAFALSSNSKYKLAVTGVLLGFGSYLATFLHYLFYDGAVKTGPIFRFSNAPDLLPQVLNAASITYLILLTIPLYRLITNWRFIKKIKSCGLHKAPLPYRLFTQKLSMRLGIGKRVNVYISTLISSPITVGFLKPIILLPLAVVNNLSTQQIEAILLHELAHIRRHDYLVNLVLTLIHVVLYFNPFIKAFLKQIEIERESSCDELVVLFEYDRVDYASALLKLETSNAQPQLALAAANKNHLLLRIEKIVGLTPKRKFETTHFAGALIGLFMLVGINSLKNITDKTNSLSEAALETVTQPSYLFMYPTEPKNMNKIVTAGQHPIASKKEAHKKGTIEIFSKTLFEPIYISAADGFLFASNNENQRTLFLEEKKQVETTISNTKKVLESQWSDVEKAMADAMTASEKAQAKKDYLQELDNFDWDKLEKDLENTYNQRDWNQITNSVSHALAKAQLDSIETTCKQVLSELHKMDGSITDSLLALPDVSLQEITKAKARIKLQLEAVRKAKSKKVIHL